MKNTQKQDFAVNALLILLMILFFLSGSLMWSQHHQYQNTSWMGAGHHSQSLLSPFYGNASGR